jgi:hypothetical protein
MVRVQSSEEWEERELFSCGSLSNPLVVLHCLLEAFIRQSYFVGITISPAGKG